MPEKLTRRQRSARRYVRDVRAIAKQKNLPFQRARKFYGAAVRRFDLDRNSISRKTLLAQTVKVKRIVKPRPPKPTPPGGDAPKGFQIIWTGRAFAFTLRNVAGAEIEPRLLKKLAATYAATLDIRGPNNEQLGGEFSIRWKFSGSTVDGWWVVYHSAVRRESGIKHGEERGGKTLYQRIKEEFGVDAFSIDIIALVRQL